MLQLVLSIILKSRGLTIIPLETRRFFYCRFPLYRLDFSNAVDDKCMNAGASVMAKSLFASLPCCSPKGAVNFLPQNDASSTKDNKFSHLHGNIQGNFHELHNAIISEKHSKVNIGLHTLLT